MTFQVLTKSQMNEKKLIKPLDSFFKDKEGRPLCYGEFGKYQNTKNCSDCKYKKECYKKYEEEWDKN